MWYPKKAAFRAGRVVGTIWDDAQIGTSSIGMGEQTQASGNYSTAMGLNTSSSGDYSTAIGYGTDATASGAVALGYQTIANGQGSVAMGYSTEASQNYSTAMGQMTLATGVASTTMGYNTRANGSYSTAMGYSTNANGYSATAIGQSTSAGGNYSTSMGYQTTASGSNSTAMGYSTTASGLSSIAMCQSTIASGNYSISMGQNTTASGNNTTATGNQTTASGPYSTAMGTYVSTNNASGSFIIGDASTTVTTNSSTINEMTMRFAGGYKLYSTSAANIGVTLLAGANSWITLSDSTKKEKFEKSDGEYFLNSLSKLRLGSWNYKGQEPAQFRHYGPMAQEIFKYFGKDAYGTIGNDTTLATADMDGIMMICLQALEKRTKEMNAKQAQLDATVSELQKANDKIAHLENQLLQQKASQENINADLIERIEKLNQLLSSSTTGNHSQFTTHLTKEIQQ
jgi:hypothetical protein